MIITSLKDSIPTKVATINGKEYALGRIPLSNEIDGIKNTSSEGNDNVEPLALIVRKEGEVVWTVLRYSFAEIFLRAVMIDPEKWGITDIKRHIICRDYDRLAIQNLGEPKKEVYRRLVRKSIEEMDLEGYED